MKQVHENRKLTDPNVHTQQDTQSDTMTQIHRYTGMYVFNAWLHMHEHACMNTCASVRTCVTYVSVYISMATYTYVHMCERVCVCVWACVCSCWSSWLLGGLGRLLSPLLSSWKTANLGCNLDLFVSPETPRSSTFSTYPAFSEGAPETCIVCRDS